MKRDWTVKIEKETDPYGAGWVVYYVITRDAYGNIIQVKRNSTFFRANETRREIQEKINQAKFENNGE